MSYRSSLGSTDSLVLRRTLRFGVAPLIAIAMCAAAAFAADEVAHWFSSQFGGRPLGGGSSAWADRSITPPPDGFDPSATVTPIDHSVMTSLPQVVSIEDIFSRVGH